MSIASKSEIFSTPSVPVHDKTKVFDLNTVCKFVVVELSLGAVARFKIERDFLYPITML